jgi:3D (Asp-Asp-Asp) domain-containing protein
MNIPGYGWGVVKDRGGAIKGPDRLDVFFPSHARTKEWGRQTLMVEIDR